LPRDRPIVASRRLKLDRSRAVYIRIWPPYRAKRDYACMYEIRGLPEHKLGRVMGVDTLQALLLTIQAVQIQLRPYRSRLSWVGSGGGDDGLPRIMLFKNPLNELLCERLDGVLAEYEREIAEKGPAEFVKQLRKKR
jgi:hypothetical protein